MIISENHLLDIYRKSLSLKEVLSNKLSSSNGDNNRKNEEKVVKWSKIIADGNEEKFHKRFTWSNIDPLQLNRILNFDFVSDVQRTSWISTLKECLNIFPETVGTLKETKNSQILNCGSVLPFGEIVLYFIQYAKEQLKTQILRDYNLLSELAYTALERSLLVWLCQLNSLTMQLEFSAFRAAYQPSYKKVFKEKIDDSSKWYYEKFVLDLINGKLLDFFYEYPVLARLISTSVEFWIESTIEFIRRFKNDKADIESIFFEGRELGEIIDIKPSLSDRHGKGRSVMVLIFATGEKLVYKPKNLSIEKAYNRFIEWMNSNGSPNTLKSFKVLNRRDYGWAEFVQKKPLEGEVVARSYYKRAGALLCLVHILGATDLHYENIIENGEFPVLIDLETLLHPLTYDSNTGANAYMEANNIIINSVLRTGLLPRWNLDEKNEAYDASGFGAHLPQTLNIESLKWSNVNTDTMEVKREKSSFQFQKLLIQKESDSVNVMHFINDLIDGFQETYLYFWSNCELILHSPCWKAFSHQAIRFVFRPTQVYIKIQENLQLPSLLGNGIDRSICLDILYRGMTKTNRPPLWWFLIEREQEEMEIMDIPHFTVSTSSSIIKLPSGKKVKYFTEPSFTTAQRRLRKLNTQDLRLQIDIIQSALTSRNADTNHSILSEREAVNAVEGRSLTKAKALERAISISALLEEKAIMGEDGSLTWISSKYVPMIKRHQMGPISYNIYDGTTGIAFFYAALFSVIQRKEYKEKVLNILKIPLNCIEDNNISFLKTMGGFAGYGSIIYSFFKLGVILNEELLISAAKRAALYITEEFIDNDDNYDVMYGSAGLLLSMVEMYNHTEDRTIMNILTYAGDHLVKKRSLTSQKYKVWKSADGSFLTGFSHGAAGIAYALLRLYKISGNCLYKEAAAEAIFYEKSVFDAKVRNWPDFRKPVPGEGARSDISGFMSTWCHGATGIGIARVATLDVLDTEDIRYDIQVAIETTKAYLSSAVDHVCCGNFGRLELLLLASMKLSDKSLYEYALKKAGEIIKISEDSKCFRYNPMIGFTPGFFQGIAGIGYQILRLTHPELLPSILILN